MADTVAIVSVVSSGIVAISGLAVSYWSGREQRQHENRLAFEGRAWEAKSGGLFAVISDARRLIDALQPTRDASRDSNIGVAVARSANGLEEQVPVVEAYGSVECREAFEDLRRLLQNSGYDVLA